MKGRLLILIGILAVVVLTAGIYWQGNVDHKSSFIFFEPRYQGEKLSYWVRNLYSYDQTRHLNYSSQQAILHIGTDGLPLLLNWISKPRAGFGAPGTIEYQRHAVDAFEILGPIAKPAVPQLLKNVSKDSGYSMQALVFIGKDAVQPMADKLSETLADRRKAVMNWRDPGYQGNFFHVQESLIHGFGEMGTNAEAAIPVVTKALYADHTWRWQTGGDPYSTLVSIGQNHADVVIHALIDVLTNAAAPASNRGAVAHAIGLFGTNHGDAFLPVLISTINDKRTDDWNRRTMAGALAVVGRNHPDLIVPVLMEAFTNSSVEYRDGIADALAALGSEASPALPMLLIAARSPYFNLREKAAVAVKKIAPERTGSLAPLIQDLNNPEPGFRQQAIYALGSLGTNGIEAVPALINCLSRPDAQTRLDATRALNEIGVTSDDYISALGDDLSLTNAQEAVSTLGKFAARSHLAFVILIKKGICGSGSLEDRQQAKWSLVDTSREDPRFLVECLDHPDVAVRLGALMVFYELARNVPESVPKLRRMAANDPDANIRSRAADILRYQSR